MSFARGQIWVVSDDGYYTDKARPGLLIQADQLAEHDSLLFCLLYGAEHAGDPVDFRIAVTATEGNGLRKPSMIAVDKIVTVRRSRVTVACGVLEEDIMGQVNAALVVFQGLA